MYLETNGPDSTQTQLIEFDNIVSGIQDPGYTKNNMVFEKLMDNTVLKLSSYSTQLETILKVVVELFHCLENYKIERKDCKKDIVDIEASNKIHDVNKTVNDWSVCISLDCLNYILGLYKLRGHNSQYQNQEASVDQTLADVGNYTDLNNGTVNVAVEAGLLQDSCLNKMELTEILVDDQFFRMNFYNYWWYVQMLENNKD